MRSASGVEPGGRAGRPARRRWVDQEQVDQPVLVHGAAGEGGRFERRRLVAAAQQQQPVDLTGAEVDPVVLAPVGAEQHEVMPLFDGGEPFGGGVLRFGAEHGDGIAQRLQRPLDLLHQGAHRRPLRRADETQDARRGHAGGGHGLARPDDHQPGQLGHQRRIAPGGGEEGVTGQGQDFRVAHGDHGGRVGRAGDQRHLAGRLAGFDHAQELAFAVLALADHPQPPGAHQVQAVGVFAGGVEGAPAG